ncbi:hypothetical protein ASG40_11480 [Methylobacterium sp. Leaf399]|uniref:hypothetical protein n=1 Tax=Methylobacterium sp. Leaf399 TaxID=1736364 RepID=UPI0006F2D459|nr:hypothetical protein [Methylobacterium sp. Leaf399]KQT08495.1 hypothetical protein ASG40_11480 [Methylobacterium sp. Leaf399]
MTPPLTASSATMETDVQLTPIEELAKAALELASYASYAEMVGAIGHNRDQIRKWCDEVYRIRETVVSPGLADDPYFPAALAAAPTPSDPERVRHDGDGWDEVEVAARCIAARRKGGAYCDGGRVTDAEWRAEIPAAEASIFALRSRSYLKWAAPVTAPQAEGDA